MIPSKFLPDEGLYNAIMLEVKSLISMVFQTLERSSCCFPLSYSNDFSKDTKTLIGLLQDRSTMPMIHSIFPLATDLTVLMLKHVLTLQNERALNFNSNIEDVVMISIMLRRLIDSFSITAVFGVEFRRNEMNAMRKIGIARNQELNEVEKTLERHQEKASLQCLGYPKRNMCFEMAVGKPQGKKRCVKLCKKCMSNRQSDIAKQGVLKKIEKRKGGDQEEEGWELLDQIRQKKNSKY